VRILICGDRNWTDKAFIKSKLQSFALLYTDITVIHGNARGADKLAGEAAKELGFKVIPVDAQWARYGKSAGPVRNREMLGYAPNLIWAFHDNISESKGTADMIKAAKQLGHRPELYFHT